MIAILYFANIFSLYLQTRSISALANFVVVCSMWIQFITADIFAVDIFLSSQFVTYTTLLAKDRELTDDKVFILCTSQDLFSASQEISF